MIYFLNYQLTVLNIKNNVIFVLYYLVLPIFFYSHIKLFLFQIIKQVVKLREINPELKVLLSIMHFSNGTNSNEGFSGVIANKNNLDK